MEWGGKKEGMKEEKESRKGGRAGRWQDHYIPGRECWFGHFLKTNKQTNKHGATEDEAISDPQFPHVFHEDYHS